MHPRWLARQSCTDVEHPELGRSFRYATSKWLATGTSWSVGRRAPLLNEDAKTGVLPRGPDLPGVDASAGGPPDGGAPAVPTLAVDRCLGAPPPRGGTLPPRQAVPAARRPHSRLHVVPGLGRWHAIPQCVLPRGHHGRSEEPPGHVR